MRNEKDIIKLPNLLLVAGSGRNVGKTTVACNVVSEVSRMNEIVAIKVSPHFHQLTDSLLILMEVPGLVIAEERDRATGKDSSRFLRGGATKSYYVQGSDETIPLLAEWIKHNIAGDIPIVCESGGLGRHIEPGGAIYIYSESDKKKSDWIFNYKRVMSNSTPENINVSIRWNKNRWII